MNPLTSTMATVTESSQTTDMTMTTTEAPMPLASQGELLAVSILLITFSIFGTLGNGLVLYVFTRKSDKVTSTIFILSLAWCDFFTCLVIMPFTVANIQLDDALVYDFLCKFYQFLITSGVPLSAFIMVAVAVDRYFSICHPFLHAVTPRRARIAILCLCLFAFTLGSITACMFGVYTIQPAEDCGNETDQVSTIMPNTFGENYGYAMNTSFSGSVSQEMNNYNIVYDSSSLRDVPNQQNDSRNFSQLRTETPPCNKSQGEILVYNEGGKCQLSTILLSNSFFEWYHKIYISFYVISLTSVFTLYFFIYRSVVKRRAWRKKQKSWSHSPMTTATNNAHAANVKTTLTTLDQTNNETENMELNPKSSDDDGNKGEKSGSGEGANKHNGEERAADSEQSGRKITAGTPLKDGNQENGTNKTSRQFSSSAEKKSSRERRDFNFLANIRTAVMLFVVTIVFIISFLPAWLMATLLIKYHVVVFYMYFIYNVANPVIYAFMNQSFRKELKRVFQRGTHFFRSA